MRYCVVLFVISVFILNSCKLFECENEVAGKYEFEIPVTISPALDTFKVGDTITVESIFSREVFERKTQRRYTLDDFSFYPETFIGKIDTVPLNNRAIELFDYDICEKCDYTKRVFNTSSRVVLQGQYNYDGETYSLKITFIPKQEGLFILQQANGLNPLGERQTFPGQCGKNNIEAVMHLNDGADNNRAFLFESQDSSLIIWATNGSGDRYADSGSYCFYVKE